MLTLTGVVCETVWCAGAEERVPRDPWWVYEEVHGLDRIRPPVIEYERGSARGEPGTPEEVWHATPCPERALRG